MQDTSSHSTPPPIPGAPSVPSENNFSNTSSGSSSQEGGNNSQQQQQFSQGGGRPQHRGNRRPRNRRPFQHNKDRDRRNFRPNPAGQSENQTPRENEFIPLPDADPNAEPTFSEGIVELSGKGFGFLREARRGYAASLNDIFVTSEVIRGFNLRDGVCISIKPYYRVPHRRKARGSDRTQMPKPLNTNFHHCPLDSNTHSLARRYCTVLITPSLMPNFGCHPSA